MRLETAIMICTHLIHVSRWPVACICGGLAGDLGGGLGWTSNVDLGWIGGGLVNGFGVDWGWIGVDWGGLVLVLVSLHYRNRHIFVF